MGRLEKKQAGAVSVGVCGVVIMFLAVVLTVVEVNGNLALGMGGCGAAMLFVGIAVNSRVSHEMIQDGRR